MPIKRIVIATPLVVSLSGCGFLPWGSSHTTTPTYHEENHLLLPMASAGTDAGTVMNRRDNLVTGYLQFPLMKSDTLIATSEYLGYLDGMLSSHAKGYFESRAVNPEFGWGLSYLRGITDHISLGATATMATGSLPVYREPEATQGLTNWSAGVIYRMNWQIRNVNVGGSCELGGGTTEFRRYSYDIDSIFRPDSSYTVGIVPFKQTLFVRWQPIQRLGVFGGGEFRFLTKSVDDLNSHTSTAENLYGGLDLALFKGVSLQATYGFGSIDSKLSQHMIATSLRWKWNRSTPKSENNPVTDSQDQP